MRRVHNRHSFSLFVAVTRGSKNYRTFDLTSHHCFHRNSECCSARKIHPIAVGITGIARCDVPLHGFVCIQSSSRSQSSLEPVRPEFQPSPEVMEISFALCGCVLPRPQTPHRTRQSEPISCASSNCTPGLTAGECVVHPLGLVPLRVGQRSEHVVLPTSSPERCPW